MIVRLSDSLTRGLILFVALALATWLSFFGVRAGLAGRAGDGETVESLQRAVRLEPRNPEYWYRLGHYQQFNLEQSDVPGAIESYQKALALNPGFTQALVDLGTAYELSGDMAAAHDVLQRASKTYPASAEVAWRYGNFLLREGTVPEAIVELKRALQADPRRAGSVFSRVYRADPDIDSILENVLPPVPIAYLAAIAEAIDSQQYAVAQTIWMRLLKLNPHLEVGQFDKLVVALMDNGDYAAARQVWDQGIATTTQPALIQPQGSVLWDPSFESGLVNKAFSWWYKPLVEGVHVGLDLNEKLSGRQSLRLSFDGKHNPNQDLACITGVVTPGIKYLFSGWVKTRDLTGDEGVRFHLRASGPTAIPIVTTKEFHGTSPWTFVDQEWTAGPNAHLIQVCVSRDGSTNPDIHISGDAWVDDVTLVPAPLERRKP